MFLFKHSLFLVILSILCLTGGNCENINHAFPSNDLHRAASFNDLDGIDNALKRGFSVDTIDEFGNTALHMAAANGKVDAIKRLTERGANPNIKDQNGRTPLHIAAPNSEGLIFYRKYMDSINVLIDAGSRIDAQDFFGDTPLHRAVFGSSEDNIRALRRRGANPYLRNNSGQTPGDQIRSRIDSTYETINRLRGLGKNSDLEYYEDLIRKYRRLLDAVQE